MTYNATDSVLRRHYDQHLATGGATLAGSTDEGMRMAGITDNRIGASGITSGSAAASANDSSANRQSSSAHVETGAKTSGGLGFLKILIPLVILGLLAWAASKFTGKDAAMETTTEAVTDGAAGLSGQFGDFFGSTAETLGGITDADSATAALPKLESAKASLEGLTGALSGAEGTAKTAAAGAVKTGMESLGPVVDKLKGNSGIWSVLEPVLGPMMETLKGLMG